MALLQQTFFDTNERKTMKDFVGQVEYSAGGSFQQKARVALEQRYSAIIELTDRFNRQSVSYQLSKSAHLHSWLKYKEGFSANLVDTLIDEMGVTTGKSVLDPFLGSGTTSMVCKMRGINSIGIDLLPTSKISIEAKNAINDYKMDELNKLLHEVKATEIPENFTGQVNSISITQGAYPPETERQLMWWQHWIEKADYSPQIKNLFLLCLLNVLERVSYTAKDGQYLRWDYRSQKVTTANIKRIASGKPPFATILDKGILPMVTESLLQELTRIISDITVIQHRETNHVVPCPQFIQGSALFELPCLESETIDGVITSPPYCNRYDYTRTYALELAFLGIDEPKIKCLRQSLLSCTVESHSKIHLLKDLYFSLGRSKDCDAILQMVENNEALQETFAALRFRARNGELNNSGILRMVTGYFTELAFIYYELFRLCRPSSYVIFVNDNVRYGGEVVPVDVLSTDMARQIGFEPVKIYTLRQQKGNSSQQMKKYGRVPLRKSITVWKKT